LGSGCMRDTRRVGLPKGVPDDSCKCEKWVQGVSPGGVMRGGAPRSDFSAKRMLAILSCTRDGRPTQQAQAHYHWDTSQHKAATSHLLTHPCTSFVPASCRSPALDSLSRLSVEHCHSVGPPWSFEMIQRVTHIIVIRIFRSCDRLAAFHSRSREITRDRISRDGRYGEIPSRSDRPV